MATIIRFARHGCKKRPFFRMVVQDHHKPRDGRFIEHIGSFIPMNDVLEVKRERLEYWLGTGAQISDSVRNRLKIKLKEWGTGTTITPSAPKAPKAPKPAKTEMSDKPTKAKGAKAKTKEA